MYLNKLLFPTPKSTYDIKTMANEILYIPRERSLRKKFKIQRKVQDPENPESKSKKGFKGFFSKLSSSFKSTKKSTEVINTKHSPKSGESPVKHNSNDDSDCSPPKKLVLEDQENEIEENTKTNKEVGSDPEAQRPRMSQSMYSSNIMRRSMGSKTDIQPKDRPKSKKKKPGCFGFMLGNKNKKFDIDEYDGAGGSNHHHHNDLKMSDLKHLSRDIITQILEERRKGEDDSSSSEDEIENNHQGLPIKKVLFIPCWCLASRQPTKKTLIYFHGNAEDIYSASELLRNLNANLNLNVIAVEYPGYGIYKGSSNERKILCDAETVYDSLTNTLGIKEKDIILFGRSIGSGPACWLSSVKKPGGLIIMSGFTSIKAVAKHLAGAFAGALLKERFKNKKYLTTVKCPALIIHGKKDNLIPYQQSVSLYDALPGTNKRIHLPEEMTHVDYDYYDDLGRPVISFLKDFKLLDEPDFEGENNITTPNFELYKKPNPDLLVLH